MSDAELETRETFLRAIFDAPDDPTPRLIYADWLEERGDENARAIRERPIASDLTILVDHPDFFKQMTFRRMSILAKNSWFGARIVELGEINIQNAELFDTLDIAPAAQRVNTLIANASRVGYVQDPGYSFPMMKPVITNSAVEILARHRFARKLVELDLSYNGLGNDAARAIVRSPYLDNLKSLRLMDGNQIRGRVWQDVVTRFGIGAAT